MLFCRQIADPGKSAHLFLKSGEYCIRSIGRYQPGGSGNLKYHYKSNPYEICIGSKSVKNGKWEPRENDEVSIEERVCEVKNFCKLDYGKILFRLRLNWNRGSLVIEGIHIHIFRFINCRNNHFKRN